MQRQTHTHGFTLVEIMVVVIIIGVLAALIVPQIVGRVGKSKRAVAKQQIAQIESAIQMFYNDYERYPEQLIELVEGPSDVDAADIVTPSLRHKNLLDPWKREYVYKVPGDQGIFDLMSLGGDGKEGGEGDDADIVNWE